MIRISSQQIFNGGINRLQNLNSQINNTQEQVSTGKRVNKPSDDPVAAARILKLDQEVQRIDTYNRNATLATNRLELEESTLDSATDILQRVRELTVQAGSGTLSNNDRASLAAELRQRLDSSRMWPIPGMPPASTSSVVSRVIPLPLARISPEAGFTRGMKASASLRLTMG